jgi:hypothetical protein
MMTDKGQILIIDSTTNRREDLCELWSCVLGFDVVFSGGVEFFKFRKGADHKTVSVEFLLNIPPIACLLHQGDKFRYDNPNTKKLIDSCGHVVVFGGTGISAKGDWPDHWVWIPRAIGGKASASGREWKQLADWATSDPPEPAKQVDLLCAIKEPRFLIAIHILCQGFLVGERMRERVPTAIEQTRTRKWWSVPLLESAGENLVQTVTAEWGPDMPSSVAELVNWIANEPESDNVDLPTLVPKVKLEIENRIAK